MFAESWNPEPCQKKETQTRIQLIFQTRLAAEIEYDRAFARLRRMANDSGKTIEVCWPGSNGGYQVHPKVVAIGNQSDRTPQQPRRSPIITSASDLDWNAIFSGQNPIYINDLRTQRNLYLNDAAVLAQSRKPAAELLSDNAHSLNFDDELIRRCDRISQDGSLREYEYEALRWFHDSEMDRFIRKRMRLISNFWRVTYLQTSCWCGEVLQAEEVRSYGDVV